MSDDAFGIFVFARAPRPGTAKTRLIPALGANGAARLQRRLTLHALAVAAAATGTPPCLWTADDPGHRFFRALARRCGIELRPQRGRDLGERMANAFAAADRPTLLIGSDCPAMRPEHLHEAAAALHHGMDAVFITAEDGGYVLVGLRRAEPAIFAAIFEAIDWGSEQVMDQTRRRLAARGLRWAETARLWDIDRPEDLLRLRTIDDGLPERGA